MFLAKPNTFNHLHCKTFKSISEAVEYLNNRLKVPPKINDEGFEEEPMMIYPKMKFIDFALLGKIKKVYPSGVVETLDHLSEKELKKLESGDKK